MGRIGIVRHGGAVIAFVFALLVISLVAVAVLVAFALPHLRQGSPVLTPRGERVASRLHRRLERVLDPLLAWAGPRLRSLSHKLGPVTQWLERLRSRVDVDGPEAVVGRPAVSAESRDQHVTR